MLRPWLDRFGAKNNTRIDAIVLEWEAAWPELVKFALYGHGPVVSEIGSTWMGSLVAMNVLKPFSTRELDTYGGASAFLPSVWQPGFQAGSGNVWALPWLAYARFIYYRRDLLNKAGIDERTAFRTHEQLVQTLERLKASGVAAPWCVPTQRSRDTLHNIASWVWSAGGAFTSEDGRHILFNEPNARAGMRAYFDLHRYFAPSARQNSEADSLFKQGKAAVVMSGPWMWPIVPQRPDFSPGVIENIGVAVPLEKSFIGFSYLVIWKHCREERLALELAREFSSQEFLDDYASYTGPLSVRLDALDKSPLAGEPNYRAMVRALKTGRTFPQISLWGLIEEKLAAALDNIWADVLAESNPDIDAILTRHLEPLAQRLELTLSNR
jgi:multiple sugar transport system substrate-binding protein